MKNLSTQLRDYAARDIYTDAPECAESVSECRDTMDAAARRIDALTEAISDIIQSSDADDYGSLMNAILEAKEIVPMGDEGSDNG